MNELASMDWVELLRRRKEAGADQEAQNELAKYEHRAYAREAAQQSPLLAASVALNIPLYQLAKMVGATGSRSKPSLDQMTHAYRGLGEGLARANWLPR